jgi:alpha-tubulin suppressor-like RCC1 family protein
MRRSSLPAFLTATALLFGVACDSDEPAGPTPPASALRYSGIDAGYVHTCGLTSGGAVYCWGANTFGALGDGSLDDRTAPAAVSGPRDYVALDAGAGHTCALSSTGVARCWGQNDEGQLGDGTFAARTSPVTVTGGHTFVAISAGHAHTCALTGDGAAWCWGDDSAGQLGDGATPSSKSAHPIRVQFDQPFTVIRAGYYQTCGLTADGSAWCWGMNDVGQNGDDSDEPRDTPVAVSGGRVFTDIAPGDRFVCAVSNAELWCWGSNGHLQLGPSVPAPSYVPIRLENAPAADVVTSSMGASTTAGVDAYACAVRSDGRVVCWGGAIPGLRERGGIVPLDDRIRASSVAAGSQHVCVLSRDGYAYCGGANYSGQLGDGSRTSRSPLAPVRGPLVR